MGIVVNYEPCDECLEMRKMGVTLLEATGRPIEPGIPQIQNGIYPTGRWCVIKKEAAERMFSGFLDGNDTLFVDTEIYDHVMGGASVA